MDVVACPQCNTNLQNTPELAGQVVLCPQCQIQLQMPALSNAPGHDLLAGSSAQASLAPAPSPGSRPPDVTLDTAARAERRPTHVSDRLRRRSNPLAIVFTGLIIVALVVVGIAVFIADRNAKRADSMAQQLIGNWELAAGSTQFDKWEFAFHSNKQVQMLLETNQGGEVHDGRWTVTRVRGSRASVQLDWSDGTRDTMAVEFAGGQLQIDFPNVGSFGFRAAVP